MKGPAVNSKLVFYCNIFAIPKAGLNVVISKEMPFSVGS